MHRLRFVLFTIFVGQPASTGGWASLTVTVKLQEALLPAASVAEQVTVVTPLGKAAPDAGLQFTVTTPGQFSLAEGWV